MFVVDLGRIDSRMRDTRRRAVSFDQHGHRVDDQSLPNIVIEVRSTPLGSLVRVKVPNHDRKVPQKD